MNERTGLLGRPHLLTREERRRVGRERREEVPLTAHAEVPDATVRGDTIGILTAQDAQRLAELVPIRHGRMSATPFTFYRGGAAIMAADLAQLPTTEIQVQLCGDAHLSNFGLYNGPDRHLVFDLNDFDETHPGPFEWDLKRLAASVAVAGRNNELSSGKTDRAVRAAVEGYRTTIAELSEVGPLAVHYRRLESDRLESMLDSQKQLNRVEKASKKASHKNSLRALDKLTAVVDGRRVIVPDPPLIGRLLPRVRPGERWPSRTSTGIAVEGALIVGGALLSGRGVPAALVVGPLAIAMGLQAALARRMALEHLTGGFITGATAAAAMTSPVGDRSNPWWWYVIAPVTVLAAAAGSVSVVTDHTVPGALVATALFAVGAWWLSRGRGSRDCRA